MSDTSPPTSPPPYRVGYGNPPRETQFQKGQSGNPSGKRKEIKNLTAIIREALSAQVEVEVDGRNQRMTKLEISIHQLTEKAMKGDAKVLQQLIAEFQRFEHYEEKPAEPLGGADKEVMDAFYARIYRQVRADVVAEMKREAVANPSVATNEEQDQTSAEAAAPETAS